MESRETMNSIPESGKQEAEEHVSIEIEIPYTLFQFLNSENCNVQNICRICLSTNCNVLYPLLNATQKSVVMDMLMTLTTVRPTLEDGLPSSICEPCQTLVVQYYNFKIQCENSEYTLRSILKGEFVPKEEPPDHSNVPVISENVGTGVTIEIKRETELYKDVEYLEELSKDPNDKKFCLIQDTEKRKRQNLNTASKGSQNNISKNKHLKKKRKSYTCNYCSKVFSKVKAYRLHVKTKHNISGEEHTGKHSCSQCKKSFESEHDLIVHSALHTKGTLRCNQCHKQFNSKTRLRRHLQRHMQFKPYSCATCPKTFTELYALRRHMRVHTGESVEKKHACLICDKKFAAGALLAAHVARRHGGARPLECGACGKRFASRRLLASHALVHTDRKPHACAYCDRRFRHESTRNTHHRTHTGEKPYVCSFCGKSFIQNSNLTLHMRTHTGERPYSCSVCERKFSSGSALKSHERVHTGERPYSCHLCGKKFACKNMGVHMRQHTGERPFACTACPKRFINASRLRDHCRVHTGEKPFVCSLCTLTFATKSHQIRHMKSHNPSKNKKSSKRSKLIKQQPLNIANEAFTKQKVPSNKVNDAFYNDNEPLVIVHENTEGVETKNVALKINLANVQEVPLEVTGEFIIPDDSNIGSELLVVNSTENDYPTNTDVCLNTENVDINGERNYGSEMNLVTVNEGGVIMSTSSVRGTAVKLYQVD